eukprot:169987_1
MSFRFLIVFFCAISVLGNPPNTQTRTRSKSSNPKRSAKPAKDYGPLIAKLQTEVNNINVGEINGLISNHAAELTNARQELTKLSQRLSSLETAEPVQSDPSNEAINALTGRMDTFSTRIGNIQSEIESSSAMTREINDNTKRLELLEQSANDNPLDEMKKSIKQLSKRLDVMEQRNDASFKAFGQRLANITTSIGELNKNLQTVYDSTLAAALDKVMSTSLDYLSAFGQVITDIEYMSYVERVQVFVLDTLSRMKRTVLDIEYAAQFALFMDWIGGLCHYVHFWWTQGIQPAIIRQATNLYLGIQRFTAESIEYVHSHMLYHEMVFQSKPYLKMANIPEEYNGYVLDGVVVLFCFSSLMTLWFVLGLCCDCCCPRKVLETPQPQTRPKAFKNKWKKRPRK